MSALVEPELSNHVPACRCGVTCVMTVFACVGYKYAIPTVTACVFPYAAYVAVFQDRLCEAGIKQTTNSTYMQVWGSIHYLGSLSFDLTKHMLEPKESFPGLGRGRTRAS